MTVCVSNSSTSTWRAHLHILQVEPGDVNVHSLEVNVLSFCMLVSQLIDCQNVFERISLTRTSQDRADNVYIVTLA